MDKEDIVLIKQAQQNPAAFEAIYKKYTQKIFGIVFNHQLKTYSKKPLLGRIKTCPDLIYALLLTIRTS